MSHFAIQVENLSKLYTIGRLQDRPDSLQELLVNLYKKPFRHDRQSSKDDTIWALKDVSFEVQEGEVLGVIGRNGAGKSTLLKILSRITEPTSGRAIINGRVGSLLEVGTGFHPELTGRDNIYLNGAILGMRKAEIDRKFDEIVDFAEIEKFLDTPVKRYSSGMYVRLAFAVAAHLEPEILLVDEVLAVGDIAFQRKCLGKMGDVARGGRTVLFVSHNMAAIQALCDRSILIYRGSLAMNGTTPEVVQEYLRGQLNYDKTQTIHASSDNFELLDLVVEGSNGKLPTPLEPARITFRVKSIREFSDIGAHLLIEEESGNRVLGLDSRDFKSGIHSKADQYILFSFNISELPLSPGSFNLHLWIKSQADNVYDEVCIVPFTVANSKVYNSRELDRQWHGTTVAHATVEIRVD